MRKLSKALPTALLALMLAVCAFGTPAQATASTADTSGTGETSGTGDMSGTGDISGAQGTSGAAGASNPFTPAGTGTVVDNATDGDGKEFFTVVTAEGTCSTSS